MRPLLRLAESEGAANVTLWQLLTLICVAAPVGGSLASVRIAKAGFRGYALAITLGLVVGACCALAMWVAGNAVGARIRRLSAALHERYFRILYLGATFWVIVAGFLGGWLSAVLLRLVF